LYDLLKLLRYDASGPYPHQIQVPGMHRALHLHQAHAISWLMHQERSRAGAGFLAGDKEFAQEEIIGFCVMERLLYRARQKRMEEMASNPTSHLVGCAQCPSETTGK
jgi:hypothetical protein